MMLHSRAHAFLVMVCPLVAFLVGAWLAIFQPDHILWGLLGLGGAITCALHFLQPDTSRRASLRIMRALENAPAGLLLLDLEGRVEWANRAIETILGYPPSELTGQPLADLLTGKDGAGVQNEREHLLSGERADLEGYLKTASGRTIWSRAHANLLRNDRGMPESIIVQILDLSAARDAESAAAQSASRMLQTIDLSTELVINADLKGRITYANAAATELLAGAHDVLEGKSILNYVSADARGDFVTAFKSCTRLDDTVELSPLKLLSGGRGAPETDARMVSATLRAMAGDGNGIAIVCRDRHDQFASLEQLRSSEARFSRIFHSSPDAILIMRRADNLILDFNAGFTRLLGYTREDAIGCVETDLNLFADRGERRRIARALARTSETTDLETRLQTKSGELITVEISLRYIEIDGELCSLCIGRDITNRVMAEAALRASEAKFEQVFTQSPDGIVILKQKDLVICDVNDSFTAASEYSRDELLGRKVDEFNAFQAEGALAGAIKSLSHQGAISNQEMALRTKNGHSIQCLISATCIEINSEPCVLVIAKNINDLRDAEKRLRQSEQRFRGAFENSPIGIVLVDLDGNIFQSNHFARQVLGYEVEPLEGLHVSRLVPPEDRAQFKATLERMLSGREDTVRMERRMLRNDAMEIWTNFHIVVQRGSKKQPLYFIGQIADITEMKSSQNRMERMAFYDTLTNLANRRLFYDRLGQAVDHAQRSTHLSALLYLDLDQFKRVNDTLGHDIGDILLQEVSTRLTSCVRKEDTVARLGGDEFTVLLFDIRSPSDASLVADKILQALRQPLDISGHQLVITTSIGITIVPQDGTDPNSLMKNADLAMYRAKEQGRNTYHFYSEEMNSNAITRLRTEYELRRALERHEFVLYYQPKLRLADQQVTGVECLIRWRHPDRGVLAPVEFIEVAEETGAIVDIGNWIIAEACRAATVLSDQARRSIQIAVNISPRQFKDPNLVATIRRNVRETGLNPASMELEITETMLMGNVDAANQTVQQLHDLGVRLAIDDFGTGYSSLNYLKKFPINTVKVDRSFITDIPQSADDKAITSAVIAMAHRLNMEVVAEGVETREQLEFLNEHGCEYAQGYLFSKPLPLEDIRLLIQPNVRLMQRR